LVKVNNRQWTEKNFIYADSSWFRLFHFEFLAGNAAQFGTRNGVILTTALAQRYFGGNTAVGGTITIDSTGYSVLGVVADNPGNSSFQFDLFLPQAAWFREPGHARAKSDWANFSARTFIRLSPGAAIGNCAAQLNAWIR